MQSAENRIWSIDCTRAICMLYIVGFWHLSEYIGINVGNPITYQATHGILATFTFISGYFLGKKKVESIKDVFLFYLKRLASFYPLFFVACIFLYRIGYIVQFKQLILTVLGASCLIPPAPMTVWYLCMLMTFYFITPIINAHSKSKVKVMIIVGIWLLLIAAMIFRNVDIRLSFYWPFYCAGILYSKKISNKVDFRAMLFAIAIFGLVSINIGNGIEIFSFVTSGCIVVFMFNLGQILKNTILLGIMLRISYASMCMYLFHRPFYLWTLKMGGVLKGYFIALPVLFALCYGIQYLYDKFVKSRIDVYIANMYEKKEFMKG